MKKYFQKFVGVFLIVAIATSFCNMQVLAVDMEQQEASNQVFLVQTWRSRYENLSCHFKSHMNTATRYFDGNTILCSFKPHSATSGKFKVTLVNADTGYRHATITCDRNVGHSITWGDVGAGNYYLYFETTNDGAYVYIEDLKMYNP